MSRLASLILPSQPLFYSLLKREQKICVEFANHMRQFSLERKLPYVWFHIANEFLPYKKNKENSIQPNFSFELKLKHMGKIAGAPDYCFVSQKDSFFIEFKVEKGEQTDNQQIFEEWCAYTNIDYFLCRSAKQGISVVNERLKNIHQS